MVNEISATISKKSTTLLEISFNSVGNLKEALLDAKENGIADVSDKFDSKIDTDYPTSLTSSINSGIWSFIKDTEDVIKSADNISTFEINFIVIGNKIYFVFAFKKFYNGNTDFDWVTSELFVSEQLIEETGGWSSDTLYTTPIDNVILDITLGGVTTEVTIENIDYKSYQT